VGAPRRDLDLAAVTLHTSHGCKHVCAYCALHHWVCGRPGTTGAPLSGRGRADGPGCGPGVRWMRPAAVRCVCTPVYNCCSWGRITCRAGRGQARSARQSLRARGCATCWPTRACRTRRALARRAPRARARTFLSALRAGQRAASPWCRTRACCQEASACRPAARALGAARTGLGCCPEKAHFEPRRQRRHRQEGSRRSVLPRLLRAAASRAAGARGAPTPRPARAQVEHIQFEGMDSDVSGTCYGASIPVDKAVTPRDDVILAYEMNGRRAPPSPARAPAQVAAGRPGRRRRRRHRRLAFVTCSHLRAYSHRGLLLNLASPLLPAYCVSARQHPSSRPAWLRLRARARLRAAARRAERARGAAAQPCSELGLRGAARAR